jgi:hypothetical protein
VAKRSEDEAKRSKAMVSSSLVPIDSTHKQQKQRLVVADGGVVAIVFVGIASLTLTLAPPLLGSKLAVNKKRAVHHAKGNSNSNSKVAANVTSKSL